MSNMWWRKFLAWCRASSSTPPSAVPANADMQLTSAVIPGVSIVYENASGSPEGTTYEFVIATDGKLYGLRGFLVRVESGTPYAARQNDRGQSTLEVVTLSVDFPIRDFKTKALYRTSTPYGPERDRINGIAMQIFSSLILGPLQLVVAVKFSPRIH